MNTHFTKWASCWLHFEIGKKIYSQWFRQMQQHKKILKSSISEKNVPFLFMQQATNVSFQQEFLDYCIRYILFLLLFTQQAIPKNNVQFFAISIMYPRKNPIQHCYLFHGKKNTRQEEWHFVCTTIKHSVLHMAKTNYEYNSFVIKLS